MNQYQELAQKLKPYIINWKLQTSQTNVVVTTPTPSTIPWSAINFAGSSLADIISRPHSVLTGLPSDDHTQYVRQGGRSGYALIDSVLRTRYTVDSRYRSDYYSLGVSGTVINSYDDTAAVYLPITIDGSTVALRPSGSSSLGMAIAATGAVTTADDTDTLHKFGRGFMGYAGYSDYAAFGHRDWASAGNYALMQGGSDASVYLNAPSGNSIKIRNNNSDRLAIDNVGTWYSGLTQLNTDNYASQVSGLHLGYDGSIDCRYLYTDQLHAKAFIADLEQALAGAQIIAKSVTILDQAFSVPFPGLSSSLLVKDLPSAHGMQVFQANDYIRLRQFSRSGGGLDISDCWGQVSSPVDNANGTQTWAFTRSGTATYSTITYIASAASTGSSNSVVINKPTGTLSGHAMVAAIATVAAATITPPSGWVYRDVKTGTGVSLSIFHKLAGGSEPSTYTWTLSSSTGYAGTIASYSNCYAANYVDTSAGQSNSSSTSMVAPTVTPQTGAGMLLFFGGVAGNIRSTPPGSMTERIDTGATGIGIYLAEQLLASGSATGTKTATLASSATSVAENVILLPNWTALSTTAGQIQPGSAVAKDAIILDYGVSGNGFAEVNAIDGIYAVNSPYYQIVTWATHPTTQTIRMRLGNMAGLTANINGSGLTPTGYGLFTDNAFLAGTFVAGGGYYRVDSNGANITTGGDVDWSLVSAHESIALSNYQSYSFSDSNGYFGGMAGGTASTYDRVVIYNQQQYIDKEAQIAIDARTVSHDVLGTPTYDRNATVTIAASKWFPDSGVVNSASIEVKATNTGFVRRITMTGDGFYFNTTPITALSGAFGITGNTTITGTLDTTSTITVTPTNTSINGVKISMPSSNTAYAYMAYYNGNYRYGVYARSNLSLVELISTDLGNTVAGPYVSIGYNSNATVPSAGSMQMVNRSGSTYAVWVDASGNVRIHTAAPTSAASDLNGSVIGTQTSMAAAKNISEALPNSLEALQGIWNAAQSGLRAWHYKSGAYNNEFFPNGIVTDYAPRYGLDRDAKHPAGKSLNVPVAIGDLIMVVSLIMKKLGVKSEEDLATWLQT